jgi:L-serine dehydratase
LDSPSLLNDVLGPVMRGPSSSHTAGSYHIGRVVRDLCGGEPAAAEFVFDPDGSYARTFREQGVDLALATGLLGRPITDARFEKALSIARRRGLRVTFRISPLPGATHPNTVGIRVESGTGSSLRAMAQSTGGGTFLVTEVDGWPVGITGKAHDVLAFGDRTAARYLAELLRADLPLFERPDRQVRDGETLLALRFSQPPPREFIERLEATRGIRRVLRAAPVYFLQRGRPLFESGAGMVRLALENGWSLGRAALAYEAGLLGLTEKDVMDEFLRRFDIMRASVVDGLRGSSVRMQLLRPTAGKIWRAEKAGKLAAGGLPARAAARAMAVMHVSNSMGIVCAAPTGGSAGVIPGVIVTMSEDWKLPRKLVARSLLAAGAVGLILAKRATFAAEIAGCQVEIGAAGAMAAAAVVEAAGGTAAQAADAAAIGFQNTMGSVCDLVQGMCEIPCHTRNAAAAAGAFVCADLVLGGYENPVPLDETIDAVFACGKMLPPELRCTARGGLAMAPSAQRLPNLKKGKIR